MNRRKKEADQHKGWNISISGVFIAMVMGIVLISWLQRLFLFRFTGMQWSKVQ